MKKLQHVFCILLLIATITSSPSLYAQNPSVEEDVLGMEIFPNPVLNYQILTLEVKATKEEIVHFYIFDFAGKLVQQSINNIAQIENESIQLKIQLEDEGLYFAKVVRENKDTHYKTSCVKKVYVR